MWVSCRFEKFYSGERWFFFVRCFNMLEEWRRGICSNIFRHFHSNIIRAIIKLRASVGVSFHLVSLFWGKISEYFMIWYLKYFLIQQIKQFSDRKNYFHESFESCVEASVSVVQTNWESSWKTGNSPHTLAIDIRVSAQTMARCCKT